MTFTKYEISNMTNNYFSGDFDGDTEIAYHCEYGNVKEVDINHLISTQQMTISEAFTNAYGDFEMILHDSNYNFYHYRRTPKIVELLKIIPNQSDFLPDTEPPYQPQ